MESVEAVDPAAAAAAAAAASNDEGGDQSGIDGLGSGPCVIARTCRSGNITPLTESQLQDEALVSSKSSWSLSESTVPTSRRNSVKYLGSRAAPDEGGGTDDSS
jgi:hypothetical protein